MRIRRNAVQKEGKQMFRTIRGGDPEGRKSMSMSRNSGGGVARMAAPLAAGALVGAEEKGERMRVRPSNHERLRKTGGPWVAATSAVLVATLLLTSPAGAHVTSNLSHLIGHLKKTFYTKSASDSRYYTRSRADTTFARRAQIKAIRVDTDITGDAAYPGAGAPVIASHELTVRGHCETAASSLQLRLTVTSSISASLHMTVSQANEGGTPNLVQRHVPLTANTPTDVFLAGGDFPGKIHTEGQLVYTNSNRVITVVFHASRDKEFDRCQVMGTALSP